LNKQLISGFWAGSVLFLATAAFAAGSAGIEVGIDSARALGKGSAVVADPQDASTLVYNPAGLTQLEGNQMAMGTTILLGLTSYTNTAGYEEDASAMPAYIPSFFVALDTPCEKLKIGGGVNAPFGLQTQYDSDGSFKYTGISSEIKAIYYTVGAAIEIAPWLSIGGGASYTDSDLRQISKLNSEFITISNGGAAGTPDANTEIDGEGHGMGWSMGALVTPNEQMTLGFFYRSAVRTSIHGEYNADNLQGPIMTAVFGGSSFRTSADTDITFPDSAVVGIMYKINEQLDIEVDFGWTGWGKFDHFDFAYGTTNSVLSAVDPSEHKFADSISINVGGSYKLNEHWRTLLGYAFYEQAALENDYHNVFPDGDRHNITFGIQYIADRFTIAVAYAAQFVSEVSIDNAVGAVSNDSIDGDYEGLYHVLSASFTYRFG
jgi:long-chain fatty acid transport protein